VQLGSEARLRPFKRPRFGPAMSARAHMIDQELRGILVEKSHEIVRADGTGSQASLVSHSLSFLPAAINASQPSF